VDYGQANTIFIIGILLGIPFFFFFGWLSDNIGRKYIILMGMLLSIICFRPIFSGMYQTANLQHKIENKASINISTNTESFPGGGVMVATSTKHFYTDGTISTEIKKVITVSSTRKEDFQKTITLSNAGKWRIIFFIFLLEFIFAVSYAPVAAFMVEMFPLKIRYTSLSLPYHFGFGIFGGMAPYFASYLVQKASEGNKPDYYLAGLTYPIALMSVSLVIGLLYLKENKTEPSLKLINSIKTNQLKRWLGIVWIALGFFAAWFGIFKMGIPKIISGNQEDVVFGIIMMIIITPVAALGLTLFGKYSLQGEYGE
jgi:MFS family permease